jgi:hypothetical protein
MKNQKFYSFTAHSLRQRNHYNLIYHNHILNFTYSVIFIYKVLSHLDEPLEQNNELLNHSYLIKI